MRWHVPYYLPQGPNAWCSCHSSVIKWLSLWSLSRQVQKSLSRTDMLLWKEGESIQSYLRAQDICCVAVFKSSTVSVFWKQSSMFHRRTVPSDFSAQYKWNSWACQRCRSWICFQQSCLWPLYWGSVCCQTKTVQNRKKWKHHVFTLISNNSIFLGIVLILCHASKTLRESL